MHDPSAVAAAPYRGKLADPEFRHQRARKAALARTSLSAHVRAVLDRAGELSDADLAELRAVLPPVPAETADVAA